jgi:hypothetical protein
MRMPAHRKSEYTSWENGFPDAFSSRVGEEFPYTLLFATITKAQKLHNRLS